MKKKNNKNKIRSEDIFFSFKTIRNKREKELHKEEIDKEMEHVNIYHNHMPRKLEHKKSNTTKIFFIGILVLIISSAVFYFYGRSFFVGGQFFTGSDVKLGIEGAKNVASGEDVSYVVKYKNLESIDLSNAMLTLDYPSSFVYKKAKPLPTDRDNKTWDVGYIAQGRVGEIEVFGSFIGEIDQVDKIKANLDFNLGGNKSTGKQKTEIEVKISESVLGLDVASPHQLLGNEIELVVKYSNKSDNDIENLKINIDYPQDFVFVESEPIKPEKNNYDKIWLINGLNAGQTEELVIKGKFNEIEAKDQDRIFKVQFGMLDIDDIFYVQAENEFSTKITKGDLSIDLKLNESLNNSVIVFGDVLNYDVSYKNNSQLNFKDATIKLIINSNIIDWTSLTDENGGVVVDEEIINGMLARSITWNLDEIQKDNEGNFVVSINTKKYSELDRTSSLDLRAEARVNINIKTIEEDEVNKNIEGNKIIAQVNTELDLQTEAELQNNNEYQILWKITNSIHEVENVKILANLADDIDWLSSSSVTVGDIYYDPSTKQVSWQINRIPVGVDIPLVADFKIKTNNTTTRPKLLVDLKLSAVDNVTGVEIAKEYLDVMGQ